MTASDSAEEPVFEAPWEAEAFAIVHALHAAGHFEWREWSGTLASVIANEPGTAYSRCWLSALEQIVATKGLAAEEDQHARRRAWRKAYENTPHGQPVELAPVEERERS